MKCRSFTVSLTVLLFLILVMTMPVFGGGSQELSSLPGETSTEAAGSPVKRADRVVIIDMMGRTVEIPVPSEIHRVAILTSPQVLTAYLLGIQDKLCAVTNAVKRWNRLAAKDPRLADIPAVRGRYAQVNIEALIETDPDVCLGSDGDMAAVDKNSGLPTLHLSRSEPGKYFEHQQEEIEFIGKALGREERARVYVDYIHSVLNNIQLGVSDLPPGKQRVVYFGFGPDHLITYGGDTYMQEWIEAAGCVNAAGELSTAGGKEGGLSEMSLEHVLQWDPHIIVIDEGSPDNLTADPQWADLSAVRNGRVYRLPLGLFIWNRPSVEAAALVPQWLALAAYPEVFRGIDFAEVLTDFYSDFFGFTMSDEEIRNILNPGA